ncbi:MAG TPA: hypothetical protein VLA34_01050, partial [Candidatus Krumholzibacterium sp.]|nr:hypothetical protein [Candidatus Krumholzibacterium sp.]
MKRAGKNIRRWACPGAAVLCLLAGAVSAGDILPPEVRYLGQQPPGMTPEIFAPGIVSTDAWEASGTFSPDFREYYFTRRPDHEGRDNRIMYMYYSGGRWNGPEPAPFGVDAMEFEPFITPDGEKLYFNSERPDPESGSTEDEIWYCERTPDGWRGPMLACDEINRGFAMYVSSTAEGMLYFTGVYGRQMGVYRAMPGEDGCTEPEYLPGGINDVRGASHPFVAPDESYVIFDAQPSGMLRPELFISFN